ncbi:MAG: fibronectin type III domain-containing protein [bacterium]
MSWQASPHESQPQFAGYNLYYAKKSLILAPIKELPTPIFLEKFQHEFTLTNLDSHATYFGHIRSRNRDGDISLPSLPELLIHAPTSF